MFPDEAPVGGGDNQRLREALQVCIDARHKIASEQDKLRALLETEANPVRHRYIEYQIDLIAKQLTRAAECAEVRLAYLDALKSAADWEIEAGRCAADILHWFKYWAWSLDPRTDSPLSVTPFLPFDFQEESIKWLDARVFVAREDGVVEKSRDQGWTWITTAWSTYHWKYDTFFQALFGSKNEDAVDSIEEPDTILEKVRFQIRLLPTQMLPKGFNEKKHLGYMKITNPANGSVISGEAPIPNFGRSGRYTVIFMDEHAAWPHGGRPQWTAASASSKSKISGSTPQGTQTKQAELAKSPSVPKLTLKWTLHPWKDARWYDGQTLSMDDADIAQEIDIDYEASQPGPVYLKLWSKDYHVITWSQFASVFGAQSKPVLWPSTIYQDVGTSPEHPTATGWYTRPAEVDALIRLRAGAESYDYDLKDTVFLYRSLTVYDEEIGDIWEMMCRLMEPGRERESLKYYRISHEAESERLTLSRKNKVVPAPRAWKPGATRGISEFKNALKLVDEEKPNPFKPWLWGRPAFVIVVADDQYETPVDDFGHARFQAEVAAYHFPKQVLGEPVKAQKPYAFFNDHMDQSRIAAADGFVPLLELTPGQQRERRLAHELQRAVVSQITDPQMRDHAEQSRRIHLQRMQQEEQDKDRAASRFAMPKVRFRK
jgi:hypothetical protein